MVLARRFEDDRIGTTRDQAIRIYGIPGGNENVDFVGMSQEGPYGLGLTRQVEKGLRLFSLYRETKKDDRDQNGESAFHRPRSLAAFTRDAQRRVAIIIPFPKRNKNPQPINGPGAVDIQDNRVLISH